MALDTSVDNLLKEYNAGKRVRDKVLDVFQKQLTAMTGPFYKNQEGEGEASLEYQPENHAYQWVTRMVAQMTFEDPKIDVGARAYGVDQATLYLEYLGNQWILDNTMAAAMEMPMADMLFNNAALITYLDDHDYLELEDGDPALTVRQRRLSQKEYNRDPLAIQPNFDARWESHVERWDKDDLERHAEEMNERLDEEDGLWDVSAIRQLTENTGLDELSMPGKKVEGDDMPDRKEVVICYFWERDPAEMPDGRGAEEGYHGMVHVFAVAAGGGEITPGTATQTKLREYPFYGPRWGPYTTEHVHEIPNEPWGLAPMPAVEGQMRELNVIGRAVTRSIKRYKRIVLVDDSDELFVEKVRDSEHDLVIPISGLDRNQVIPVEIGGATESMIAYVEYLRARLDRNSGFSDIQKGMVGSADTATEVMEAAAAADLITDWIKLKGRRFQAKAMKSVLWYFHEEEDTRHVLGPEVIEEEAKREGKEPLDVVAEHMAESDPGFQEMHQEALATLSKDPVRGREAMEKVDQQRKELAQQAKEDLSLGLNTFVPIYHGGQFKNQIRFEQLSIEIKPMSGERVTPGMKQQRAMQMLGLTTQVGQALPMLMASGCDPRPTLEMVADAFNYPHWAKQFDLEKARQVGEAQMQLQLESGQPAVEPQQFDIGAALGGAFKLQPGGGGRGIGGNFMGQSGGSGGAFDFQKAGAGFPAGGSQGTGGGGMAKTPKTG